MSEANEVDGVVIFHLTGEYHTDCNAMLKEINVLRNALKQFAASNAWQNFGDCRAFNGLLLKPDELDKLARDTLGI